VDGAVTAADAPVATVPDAAPAKDGALVEAGANKPADDSGCSCRVAGPSRGRPALLLVLGFGALLLRRRRR
jgi:MYXO-CTERM domain-containing protein